MRDIPLPLGVDGAPLRLRTLFYRPRQPGPYPLLVFHHGSTGRGDNPQSFRNVDAATELAEFLVRRGWLVAMPQRRGRGGSEGTYEEGVGPRGYRRDPARSELGLWRAVVDAKAVTSWLIERPEVDRTRVLLGGNSRGAVVALTQSASMTAQPPRGVLNFVGGWLGEAWDREGVNRTMFAKAGQHSRVPALFLYAARDPFYSLEFSRGNFEAFRAAGGQGRLVEFPHLGRAILDAGYSPHGHNLVHGTDLWRIPVEQFLREQGLPALGWG